jgi:type IV pilus assembly protein PilB
MASDYKRLGEMLLEAGMLTPQQLSAAIDEQKKTGTLLGATLVQMGLLTEPDLLSLIQRQLGMPLVDLEQIAADEQAVGKVKEELARRYLALPLEIEGRKTLVVAMADPLNPAALEDLRFHSGLFIRPVLAAPSQILEAIDRYYHLDNSVNEVVQSIIQSESDIVVNAYDESEDRQAIDELMREAEGRPIVRLANWLLHRAVEEGASDIHIEPESNEVIVRLRVDGLLREEQRLPKWTQGAIVSRIKVLANLDIAEKRMPQDGRLAVTIEGGRIDVRVVTLPLVKGEGVVMRILDTRAVVRELESLGMQDSEREKFVSAVTKPYGAVLVTGPTGSGKSTTLYGALSVVNDGEKSILTIEDPVESQIAGIKQMQVSVKTGVTFAIGLRSMLRADPDVIMVGEIRDRETAEIAIQAALTGHLVLSTLHTRDAASALGRLTDMGIEPFMVSAAIDCVVAQRLARQLCAHCKRVGDVPDAVREADDLWGVDLYEPVGCMRCGNTGYQGRLGLYEVMPLNDEIRAMVIERRSVSEIAASAARTGMRTMRDDGIEKVKRGLTSLAEVARVTNVF